MKHIQIRDKFLERYKSTQNFPLIQEAESGPLGNDINWGDSLLGRLLASVFRAIESGINMKRIDSLLVQLDRAIKNKIIEELSENEEFKKGVDQIQGIAAKGGIAKTVQENPEDLKEYLEGLKEAKGDEWLIAILSSFSEEFKAILDELMAREGEEGEKTGEVVADYEVMKENLKFLAGMLSTFNTIKVPQQNTSTEKPAEQNRPAEVPAKTAAPANVEHSNKPALIENYLRLLEEYAALPPGEQPKALGPGGKAEITQAKPGVKIIPGAKKVEPKRKFGADAEDVDFEEVPNQQQGATASGGTASTGTEIGKGETKLIEAYQKIKASFIELTNKKYKNLPITADMINGILKDADNPDSKKEVIMLYKTIVGMLKSGSLKLDPLIKESTALLPTQIQIASEKIARYGARCLQFEGLNFYAALGEFGKHMEGFNTTIKKLMQSTTFEATKKPEEGKPEEGKKAQGGADNKVVNYGGFDDKEAKKESKVNEGVSFLSKFFGVKVGDEAVNKIKVTGSGNTLNFYMDGKKVDAQQASGYAESKGQINGIIQDLEGKFGEQAKKTVEKNAIDLIEVIRIFNNANRIMVRNNVPSVRTGGKIDVRRANMWEMLDGSAVDINNPKGPVRNIKLFHRWNDGVLKIIKENVDILRNAEVIINDKGKTVKPKYPISKFISDSLNDNKLFQSYGSRGEKGYQSQYLESFLGVSKAEAEEITHHTSDGNKTTTEEESETKQTGDRKFSVIKTTTVAEMTNHLYKVDISAGKLGKDDIKFLYLVGIKDGKNSTLFKASASDFFFQGYVDGYKPKGKPSIIYLMSIQNTGKPLEEYKTIKGSAYSVGDAVNKKFTPISFQFKIKSIENLSDGEQPIERNPIEKDPKKYQDSGIKPDDILNGIGKNYSTVHESLFQNIPVHHTPRVFKKYSEISKKRK